MILTVFDIGNQDGTVYIVSDGGIPRQLTHEPSAEYDPTWSRDGRWVYFFSERGGSQQIWKIPSEGSEALQVTRNGGRYAVESWDGHDLYYWKATGTEWRQDLVGAEAGTCGEGQCSRSPMVG